MLSLHSYPKCLAVRLCFKLEADVCAVTCILWEALLSIGHHFEENACNLLLAFDSVLQPLMFDVILVI